MTANGRTGIVMKLHNTYFILLHRGGGTGCAIAHPLFRSYVLRHATSFLSWFSVCAPSFELLTPPLIIICTYFIDKIILLNFSNSVLDIKSIPRTTRTSARDQKDRIARMVQLNCWRTRLISIFRRWPSLVLQPCT